MLVLSRKKGQKIRIGDIEITILQIPGNRVKLGVDAPKEVRVVRGELSPHEVGSNLIITES